MTRRHLKVFLAVAVLLGLLLVAQRPSPEPQPTPNKTSSLPQGILGVSTSNSLIGLPWSGEGTGRMIVNNYSQVDHVWTAPKTGTVARVQAAMTGAYTYGAGYTGTDENQDYASGTGGIYRLDIYADDGAGNPTGPSLAYYQAAAGFVNGMRQPPGSVQTDTALRVLTPALNVTAGQKFHNIWTNPDPNANVNWYGINNFSTRGKQASTGAAQQTHLLPTSEWDVRYRSYTGPWFTGWDGLNNNLGWRSCGDQQVTGVECYLPTMHFTPMNVIYYSDYSMWGDPYFGPAVNPEDYVSNVSTSSSSRQTTTVLASTTVEGIEVSLAAKTAGTMTARITDMSGTTISGATATATVALSPAIQPSYVSSCIPYPGTPSCITNTIRKFFTFAAPVTLAPGSYAIEFSASSGSFALAIVKPDRGFYATTGPGSGDRGEAQSRPSGGSWTVVPYGSASTLTSFDIFTALTPVGSLSATTTTPATTSAPTTTAAGATTTTAAPLALAPETLCSGGIRTQAEAMTVIGTAPIVAGYRVFGSPASAMGGTTTVTPGTWHLKIRYYGAATTRTLYLTPGDTSGTYTGTTVTFPASPSAWNTVTTTAVLQGTSQDWSYSWDLSSAPPVINVDYVDLCPGAGGGTTTTTTPSSVPPANTTCLSAIPTRGVAYSGGWITPALPAYTTTVNVPADTSLQGALGGTYGPGTRIKLAAGEYSGIFTSAATFAGSLAQPITIEGGTGVTLVGRLDLSLSPYVVVTGIEFAAKSMSMTTVSGTNAVTVASTTGLVAGMSIAAAPFTVGDTLSVEIAAVTSTTTFTVADNNGGTVNASTSGMVTGKISARRALIVANANRTGNQGRGIRVTGNTFTDVGSGANASSEGIIFADHRAKARSGGWNPAAIAAAQGISESQVYTIGLGLGSSAGLTGYAPMEDLDLVVDNNTFTRPQNTVLWTSGGYAGVTFARNLIQGAEGLRGGFEQEVGGKVGFGWPQSAADHRIVWANNTYSADLASGPNPYLVGFKDPGAVFSDNQINSLNSRVSARLAHITVRGNVIHGRVLVGGTDINSDGVLDAASLVEGNWVIGDAAPTDNMPSIAITGRANSGASWDGSNAAHPNYSIIGSTTATPTVIRNNAFYLTAGDGSGALTGYDYQGTLPFVTRPSGVQFTNNYFEKWTSTSYLVSGRADVLDSPTDWYNTVDSAVWSGNRFHAHTTPHTDASTSVPALALAGGGVIGALSCDGSTAPTTTTIPYRTVTLTAYIDANSNGTRDVGETQMPAVKWRIYRGDGSLLRGGTLNLPSGTVPVPVGAGYQVRWYPLLTPTTATVVTIPATGNASITVGGCCITTITRSR